MPFGMRVALGVLLAIVVLTAALAGFCFAQPGAEETTNVLPFSPRQARQ